MLLLLWRTNFAAQMKRIALILLVIFSLVQAGPAIASLINPNTVVFIVDEEKNEDKQKEDHKKDSKKDFIRQSLQAAGMARESVLAVLRSEKIHPSPCIEKVAPPPNFY